MEDLYFIIRAGIVLALLGSVTFLAGMGVGRLLWGDVRRQAEELEFENRKLELERESLRDPGMKSSL